MERTKAFVRKTRVYILTAALLESFCRWLIVVWGMFLLWGMGDYAVQLPLAYRRGFFYFAAAAGGLYLARFAAANRPARLRDEAVIVLIQRSIRGMGDELLSAWQLYHRPPPGVSAELIGELVAKTEEKIERASPGAVLSLKAPAQRIAAAFSVLFFMSAALYVLPPRIMRPSAERILGSLPRTEWSAYFAVQPGSGSYPQAARVEIVMQRIRGFAGTPALWTRQGGGTWRKEDVVPCSVDRFGFTVDQLTSPVEYYVAWGEWRTPVFSLTPVLLPQAGEFSVRYYPPSYTGLPVQETRGTPHLSGLAGTRAEIAARTNGSVREAYLLTADGMRFPVRVAGNALSAQLIISKTTNYKFILVNNGGLTDPEPPEYGIEVLQDGAPDIELRSPREDLVVAPKSEIPLVAIAGDDFGLAKVDLVFDGDGRNGRTTIYSGTSPGNQTIEYLWKLERMELRPGEKVRYYLEARDNNTVAGPRVSATPVLTVETTDYEKEHEKIEQDLKALREELLNVLADQTVTREKLKNLQADASTDTVNGVIRAQRAIKDSIERPIAHLNALARRMEDDPYTDFATHREYKAMGGHLEYLRDVPLSDALGALEKKDYASAQRKQDEVIARLEKMALLSEDVWQYQRMRDLLDKGAELEQAGIKLNEGATSEELKKTLRQIGELLDRINRQLSKMPQELPEDFINSPAVKRIDMQSAKGTADEMNRALADGDWAKAKELAATLSRQLAELSRMLQDAANDVGFSRSGADARKGELLRAKSSMDAIARKQEELLKETERIDQRRRQAMFRRQEGLLESLAKKQAALIGAAGQWRRHADAKAPAGGWSIARSVELMRKVAEEFGQKRVYHSQKYLEDIIRQLGDAQKIVEAQQQALGPAYAALKDEGAVVVAGEEEILKALREGQLPQGLLSSGDGQQLDALSARQRALREDTRKLKGSLEEFTRRSASVAPEVFDGLEKAAGKMQDASGELAARDTPAAVESGRQALEHLSRGAQGLASSMEGIDKEGEGAGKPVGSPVRIRAGSGTTGVHNAPVRLPRADEYKPPQQFRQEIMDALKEKYPQQYEKIIKEYYRRLTE